MTVAITRPTDVAPPALSIDGEPVGSSGGIDVVDPATAGDDVPPVGVESSLPGLHAYTDVCVLRVKR